MICSKCGSQLFEGDEFCAFCGLKVNSDTSSVAEQPTNKKGIEYQDLLSKPTKDNENTNNAHLQIPPKQTSCCKRCGQPILEGDLFCAQCGQSVIEPETKATSYPSSNAAGVSAIKQSRNRPVKKYAIIGAVVIGLIALFLVIIQVSDSKRANETENKIQAVKDSMFTFLPEITVGELLDEYYSDGRWIYNARDMCVEFFGTNQMDQSGMDLHFQFTSSGTVTTPYIMFNNENETAHPISEEEIEQYIISLYNDYTAKHNSDYSDKNEPITTKATTPNTAKTSKKTTTTTTTTTLPPKPSTDYSLYLKALSEGSGYALFDINQDGITELLLYIGDGSVSSVFEVYSIIDDELENVGEIDAYSSYLSEKSGKLYLNFGHMNYQVITQINFDGFLVTLEQVSEGEVNGSYKTYGTKLPTYDTSDTSPITSLGGSSTEKTTAALPTVSANVKVFDYSSLPGSECRLYISGDFALIRLLWGYDYGNGYDWEMNPKVYHKEDIIDYIDLQFNVYANPPAAIKVTPVSDDGTEGQTIILDIPSEASDILKTASLYVSDVDMLGQINCHGGVVAGFTTDYVVNGGAVGKVRASLGDGWHIVAKRYCTNYDIMWYELWDSQDGDYYGWVDANYIDFY